MSEARASQLGVILHGINNIFTVRIENLSYLCRLKGKRLSSDHRRYNALAPGDQVYCVVDEAQQTGMITEAAPRRNAFVRWNPKRNAPQTMAANLDLMLVLASVDTPPFRPRFLDAALVAAEHAGISAGVVLNKFDLGPDETVLERMAVYASLGYQVFGCSAVNHKGVREILDATRDLAVLLVGQSGVGKSTLLNALVPGAEAKIGDLSAKYNRGRHTTRFAAAFDHPESGLIIDSPGIREFSLQLFEAAELSYAFPEMREPASRCRFSTCTHSHEPGCEVRAAFEAGIIHPDRYESYLRLLDRSCI